MQKDASIVQLLQRLRARLGLEAFDVVDHWQADLCAIGIARPDEHGILVYISLYEQTGDRYFVSLEITPQPGDKHWSNHPYTPGGEHQVESFDGLVEIIQKHFASN